MFSAMSSIYPRACVPLVPLIGVTRAMIKMGGKNQTERQEFANSISAGIISGGMLSPAAYAVELCTKSTSHYTNFSSALQTVRGKGFEHAIKGLTSTSHRMVGIGAVLGATLYAAESFKTKII